MLLQRQQPAVGHLSLLVQHLVTWPFPSGSTASEARGTQLQQSDAADARGSVRRQIPELQRIMQ